MDADSIKRLASSPKESLPDLHKRMQQLKSQGAGILLCTMYVKTNQQCPLLEARDIVLNSPAWINQKDEFMQHQEEMLHEFIAHASNDIESIKQTFSPDGTSTTINLKEDD